MPSRTTARVIPKADKTALRFVEDVRGERSVQNPARRNAAGVLRGRQHLFSSIMTILDPGEEPTEADLHRMSQIHDELEAFVRDYVREKIPTEGKA